MLTFSELGIEQWEYESLLKVLDGLKMGTIKEDNFNMEEIIDANARWSGKVTCGTAACIGGWVGIFADKTPGEIVRYVAEYREKDRPFSDLFYPPQILDWDKITTEDAVAAITNFLSTGHPNWLGVWTESFDAKG